MGVSMVTVRELRESGVEIVHLRELGLQQLPDDQILGKAAAEQRVVLTFDLDFGHLLAASRAPYPSVVIMRLKDQRPSAVTPRLRLVINECEKQLADGVVILVAERGYRVRPLPIRPVSRQG